jgi:hypothetical protein
VFHGGTLENLGTANWRPLSYGPGNPSSDLLGWPGYHQAMALTPALGAGLLTPPSSDRRSPGNTASHGFATYACFSVDWVQGRVASRETYGRGCGGVRRPAPSATRAERKGFLPDRLGWRLGWLL